MFSNYSFCLLVLVVVETCILVRGCRRNIGRWVSPQGGMTGAYLWLLLEWAPLAGLVLYLAEFVSFGLMYVRPSRIWLYLGYSLSCCVDDYFIFGQTGFLLGPVVALCVWATVLRPASRRR